MHHVFRRVPSHLEDAFDELPVIEGRVLDHVTPRATRPSVFARKFPELVRPLMSEAEAKTRAGLKRPPREVEVWLEDMLARKGMRSDNLILMWDPQMPRWSFWARSKHPNQEVGYSRVWIVGEQEAEHRGKAVDLDERAEYYQLMGTMGPYRLPTKDEIDRVMGEIATKDPDALIEYLNTKQREAEQERERQLDDFTMDYLDHRSFLDAWRLNGGIRTWCCQGGWTSEKEKVASALKGANVVEVDMGTHKVRVKKGGKFHEAAVAELAARERRPEDQRDLEFAARETRLGRVRKAAAAKKQRVL